MTARRSLPEGHGAATVFRRHPFTLTGCCNVTNGHFIYSLFGSTLVRTRAYSVRPLCARRPAAGSSGQ